MDIGLKLRGDKMEILTEATFGYTTIDAILLLITFILGMVSIIFVIESLYQVYKKESGLTPPILFSALAVIFLFSASQFEEQKGYKAIVDDYNEVFENGYEIIGNEGRIYHLVESE